MTFTLKSRLYQPWLHKNKTKHTTPFYACDFLLQMLHAVKDRHLRSDVLKYTLSYIHTHNTHNTKHTHTTHTTQNTHTHTPHTTHTKTYTQHTHTQHTQHTHTHITHSKQHPPQIMQFLSLTYDRVSGCYCVGWTHTTHNTHTIVKLIAKVDKSHNDKNKSEHTRGFAYTHSVISHIHHGFTGSGLHVCDCYVHKHTFSDFKHIFGSVARKHF